MTNPFDTINPFDAPAIKPKPAFPLVYTSEAAYLAGKPKVTFQQDPRFATAKTTPSVMTPEMQAARDEAISRGLNLVKELPGAIGGITKDIGQSIARNIGSAGLTVAGYAQTPVNMRTGQKESPVIAEPLTVNDIHSFFGQALFENIFGKGAEIKSIEQRIAEAEPQFDAWKKEVEKVSQTQDLNPREKFVTTVLANLDTPSLVFTGIMGSVGIDLTPFGGLERNAYKAMVEAKNIGEGASVLTKMGFDEALVREFAPDVVNVSDEAGAKALFQHVANLQFTTKAKPGAATQNLFDAAAPTKIAASTEKTAAGRAAGETAVAAPTLEDVKTAPELFQQTRSLENIQQGGYENYKVDEILKAFDEARMLKNPIQVGQFENGFVVTSGHNRLEILRRARAQGLLTQPDSAYMNITDYRGQGGIAAAVEESIASNIASKSVKDINLLDLYIRDAIDTSMLKNALAYDEKRIKYFTEIANTFKKNNLVDFWRGSVGTKLADLKLLDFGVMQERLNFVNRIAKKTAAATDSMDTAQAIAVQNQVAKFIAEFLATSKKATLSSVERTTAQKLDVIRSGGFKNTELTNLFGETVVETQVAKKVPVQALEAAISDTMKNPLVPQEAKQRLLALGEMLQRRDGAVTAYVNREGGLTRTAIKTQALLQNLSKMSMEELANTVATDVQRAAAKDLSAAAAKYQKEFVGAIDEIEKETGLTIRLGPVKTEKRILEKAILENGGHVEDTMDANRATAIIQSSEDAAKLLDAVKKRFTVTRVRDKFNEPIGKYRSAIFNVKTPYGNAEIAMTVPEMWEARMEAGGEQLYNQVRMKIGDYPAAQKKMNTLYADAWSSFSRRTASASGTSVPSDSALRGAYGKPVSISIPKTSLPSESTLTGVSESPTRKNLGNLGDESAIPPDITTEKAKTQPLHSAVDNSARAKEAQKYSSAEEFVKAQTPIFRGLESNVPANRMREGATPEYTGTAFSRQKVQAQKYGDLMLEKYIPETKILKPDDIPTDLLSKLRKEFDNLPADDADTVPVEKLVSKVMNLAKNRNKDAADISAFFPSMAEEAEIRVLNTNAPKTKNQLTDFYNKVKSGSATDARAAMPTGRQAQEAAIAESEARAKLPPSVGDIIANGKTLPIEQAPADALATLAKGPDGKSWQSLVKGYMYNAGPGKRAHLLDYVATPEFVLEKVGLGKGAEMLHDAEDAIRTALKKEFSTIEAWRARVDNQPYSARLIFQYLDGQEKVVAREMTPEQLDVAREIRTYLKTWADRLKLPEDNQISRYITHIFERQKGKIFETSPFEDPELAAIMAKHPAGSVFDPFLLERKGGPNYIEDVWRALDAYVKRGARKEAMDPALEFLASEAKNLDELTYNYVTKLSHRINMRPTELEKGVDSFITQTPIGQYFTERPTAFLSKKIRQTFYRGTLGLNFSSALRNISQGSNTYAKLGEKYTIIGYSKLFARMASRNLDELFEHNVLLDNLVQDRNVGVIRKGAQMVDKGLFSLFDFAEKLNRGSAYFGAKAKGLSEGLSEEQAIKYAKRIVRETQFAFGAVDTPVALNDDVLKTFTQLQTYNIKQIEFLGRMVRQKDFAGLIRWTAATLAFVYSIGRLFGMTVQQIVPTVGLGGAPFTSTMLAIPGLFSGDPQVKAKAQSQLQRNVSTLFPAGAQIRKTLQGAAALEKGKSTTPTGRFRYRVDSGDAAQVLIFGPNSLPQAQKYYDSIGKKKETVGNPFD